MASPYLPVGREWGRETEPSRNVFRSHDSVLAVSHILPLAFAGVMLFMFGVMVGMKRGLAMQSLAGPNRPAPRSGGMRHAVVAGGPREMRAEVAEPEQSTEEYER